jgi:hypothetical protein
MRENSPNNAIKSDARTSRGLWQTLGVIPLILRSSEIELGSLTGKVALVRGASRGIGRLRLNPIHG